MKLYVLLFTLLCGFTFAKAQTEPGYPGTDATTFDFWVGKWLATWGNNQHGTNQIAKELGGQILQENFSDLGSGYFEKSWTAYNKTKNVWQQTRVDNNGTYLTFVGGALGNDRVLELKQTTKGGKKELMKMVFSNIQPDSFDWELSKSTDDGKTWQSEWKIRYNREL